MEDEIPTLPLFAKMQKKLVSRAQTMPYNNGPSYLYLIVIKILKMFMIVV